MSVRISLRSSFSSYTESTVERSRIGAIHGITIQLIALMNKKREGRTESPGSRPKLDALRCLTAKHWKHVVHLFRTGRSNSYPCWQPIVQAWHAFGKALEVEKYLSVAEQTSHSVFPPLERCAWQDCLCSVYKPIHPLRVCKGCWRVVYCNAKCQTRYARPRFVSGSPVLTTSLTVTGLGGTTRVGAGLRGYCSGFIFSKNLGRCPSFSRRARNTCVGVLESNLILIGGIVGFVASPENV